MSICILNDSPVFLFGLCLFDSGSTSILINECAMPPHVWSKEYKQQMVTTTQGTYSSTKYVDAKEMIFPNFCRKIPQVHLCMYHSDTSRYAFIVGHDILKFGFILAHVHNFISWGGLSIPTYDFECPSTVKIKEAKYDLISPKEVASQCYHLSSPCKQKLS